MNRDIVVTAEERSAKQPKDAYPGDIWKFGRGFWMKTRLENYWICLNNGDYVPQSHLVDGGEILPAGMIVHLKT